MTPALNYHLKPSATATVAAARQRGDLPRPEACEACGKPNTAEGRSCIDYHHHDYAKALDLIPLCSACHGKVHRGTLVEPRTGRMYAKPELTKAPKRRQVNVRLDADQLAAIDATDEDRSTWLRRAAAERIDRDAGKSPARVALAPFVWGVIEVAVFVGLVTPAELVAEAKKYTGENDE